MRWIRYSGGDDVGAGVLRARWVLAVQPNRDEGDVVLRSSVHHAVQHAVAELVERALLTARRLRAEQSVFADPTRWAGLASAELVRTAVAEMVGSLRHQRFLRAVVLISAAHPEVQRRGSQHAQELGEGFAAVVLGVGGDITHPDPAAAVRSCFATVFAASIIRVAYGAQFATSVPVDDDTFIASLSGTAARFLLAQVVD